jgi:hypothetical protein
VPSGPWVSIKIALLSVHSFPRCKIRKNWQANVHWQLLDYHDLGVTSVANCLSFELMIFHC